MNAQSGDTFRNPRHITLESESRAAFLKPRYAFSHYSSASRLFYRDFIRIKGDHPSFSSSIGIGCQNELFFLCGSDCFAYCSSFFKQAVIVCIIVDVLGTDKTLPYDGMGIHSRTGVCIRRTAVESLERLHVRFLCLLK